VITLNSGPRLQRALLLPLVVLAWLALLVVVAWLLGHVTRALLIVILAALIAFALTPLVNLLARWMPRAIALALSYLVGLIVVFGLLGSSLQPPVPSSSASPALRPLSCARRRGSSRWCSASSSRWESPLPS
jgi:hypothetical protein